MKKFLFLLLIFTQSAYALTDSNSPTNPYLVHINEFDNDSYILYSESGIDHGIMLEDAFGVSSLSNENSEEINRIIHEVKDNIIKPASISGHAVLMQYQNFKNQELIDIYNTTVAASAKKVNDEVKAQRKRKLEIANAIKNNKKVQAHLICSSLFKETNAIYPSGRRILDSFRTCFNYIKFDISGFKSLLKDNVSEAQILHTIQQKLVEINENYSGQRFEDLMEDLFNQLKKEESLKKTCRAPRICYVPSSTKDKLKSLYSNFHRRRLPSISNLNFSLRTNLKSFKDLNITEDEDIKIYIDDVPLRGGFKGFYEKIKITISARDYYLTINTISNIEQHEMLESATSDAINKVQVKLNDWLKSLKGSDVAKILKTPLRNISIEQTKGHRYDDEDKFNEYMKRGLEIDGTVEVR